MKASVPLWRRRRRSVTALFTLTLIVGVSVMTALPQEDKPQACCFADGTCEDLARETCVERGGTPQGDGTSCSMARCPQPAEACCFADGDCEDLARGTCLDRGGSPRGDGTRCSTTSCPQPTGACCFPSGSCRDLTATDCVRQGGTPRSIGSRCATTECPQPEEACCFADGGCEDLERDTCMERGGSPRGDGTRCWTTSCPQPTEACCFADGSCTDTTAAACRARGGTPRGTGTSCNEVRCPREMQACCLPSGGCADETADDCRARGGVPQGKGTCCGELRCGGTIRLISPAGGAILNDGGGAGQFCWEDLGRSDVTYDVFYETELCDPSVLSAPHPFAPLIPDRTLDEQRATLTVKRLNLEADLEWCRDACAKRLEQIDELLKEPGGRRDELRRLRLVLAARATDAHEADVTGVFDPQLPTDCPEEMLDQFHTPPLSLDDIVPCPEATCSGCDEDACKTLDARISALVGSLQSLHACAFSNYKRFDYLVEAWVNGEKTRQRMAALEEIYGAIEEASDAADWLEEAIAEGLGSVVAAAVEALLSSEDGPKWPEEWVNAIEGAGSTVEKIDLIRDLMKGSGSLPGLLRAAVKAMAQSVAEAARKVLGGFARDALDMCVKMEEAHAASLCASRLLDWLASQREAIEKLCAECARCLEASIAAVQEEINAIAAVKAMAAHARTVYWQQQRALLASQLATVCGNLAHDAEWTAHCCRSGTETYTVPGTSDCARLAEDAIKEVLGDKACFLTFEVKCNADGMQITHSFPLPTRREGCCVPSTSQRVPLGSRPGTGKTGEKVCHPEDPEEEDDLGRGLEGEPAGGWGVEGRDAAGNPIGSSPLRPARPEGSHDTGVTPEPIPQSPPVCACSASATVGGAAVAQGSTVSNVSMGGMVAIGAAGDCGPSCAAGLQSITIQPPVVSSFGPSGFFLLPTPPLSATAASTSYDFPREGIYTVMVRQVCEDGSTCSSSFNVAITSPPGPVPRLLAPAEPMGGLPTCPSCGNDACLELACRVGEFDDETILVDGNYVTLGEPQKADLALLGWCRADCEGDRSVRWEITEPSGELIVREGLNLAEITYAFDQVGEYTLCIIEIVPCPDGDARFERWWIIDTRGDS
jgi:hypothetical protein